MANTKKIQSRLKELGLTQTQAAASLGIKQGTLSLKINNKRPFYVDEAFCLAKLLLISDEEFGAYFFAPEVA